VLKTSEGKIKTQYLIIATNGYSEKDIGNDHYNIIGVPSYIAATNILGQEKVQKLLPKLRMYSDSKNDLYYFRPSPDHKRILFGAFPVRAYGMENSNMVKSFFYKKINLILPDIDNFSIDYIWGGKVGVTFNTLPMVKKTNNKISKR
jgi:glycine/D-amino acid oxidase-like deaminating enzyme